MSTRDRELRSVADQLDLPHPVRARLLLELAADLEGLESELVSAGLSPEEARERAIRTLVPSPDAVRQLYELHRPLYRRFVDRFSDPLRHRVERTGLAVVSAALLSVAFLRLVGTGLLDRPAPLLIPVLALSVALVALSVWKLFALYVAREHDLESLNRGLWLLPVGAALAATLALGGVTLDLYAVAGRLSSDLSGQAAKLLGWLRRDMGLLSVGLLTTLLGLGMWLLISAGVAAVEQAEADMVIGIRTDPSGGTGHPKGRSIQKGAER